MQQPAYAAAPVCMSWRHRHAWATRVGAVTIRRRQRRVCRINRGVPRACSREGRRELVEEEQGMMKNMGRRMPTEAVESYLQCVECSALYVVEPEELEGAPRVVGCSNCLHEWYASERDLLWGEDEALDALGKEGSATGPKKGRGKFDEDIKDGDGGINVFVGNLSFRATEEDLFRAFSGYGVVVKCQVPSDSSGASKGYGFVVMKNRKNGLRAVEELQGTSILGRDISLNEARPRRTGVGGRNTWKGGGKEAAKESRGEGGKEVAHESGKETGEEGLQQKRKEHEEIEMRNERLPERRESDRRKEGSGTPRKEPRGALRGTDERRGGSGGSNARRTFGMKRERRQRESSPDRIKSKNS